MPTVAASPLTEAEKNDVRRFCGYPAKPADGTGGAIFFYVRTYQVLENAILWVTDASVATVRTYLTQLNTLEAAVWGASANLDTDQAAVWRHNRNEVRDRRDLFNGLRRDLCGLLSVPPGPALTGAGATRIVI